MEIKDLLIATILILVAIKSRNKEESKKVIEEYKEYFDILPETQNDGIKEINVQKTKWLDNDVWQLIENKKILFQDF